MSNRKNLARTQEVFADYELNRFYDNTLSMRPYFFASSALIK